MAIDITTGSHSVAFPSRIASSAGSPHLYDIHLAKNHDNGDLVGRGDYIKLGTYEETDPATFAGTIREATAGGTAHFVEVTADTTALFVYMPEISPYTERRLQDATLYFNAAGDTVKGYSLIIGDEVQISDDKFTGTIKQGATVSYSDGKYVIGA